MYIKRMILGALVVVAMAAASAAAADGLPAEKAPFAPQDSTLLTVGSGEVKQSHLDGILSRVEPFKRSAFADAALTRLTERLLRRAFAANRELPIDEEKFASIKKQMQQRFEEDLRDIRTQLALRQYVGEQITDDKVASYLESHPSFFDGTTLEVSRVLVRCAVHDSTAKQLAAREKLSRILADIKAKRITFAAAAAQYSDCPSKAKNGQLGRIEFGGPPKEMIIKIAGFMTEQGQVSPVIRTADGWEIVLVTKIERGDGKPKPWKDPLSGKEMAATDLARRAIISLLENQIVRMTLEECKVVNHRDPSGAPMP